VSLYVICVGGRLLFLYVQFPNIDKYVRSSVGKVPGNKPFQRLLFIFVDSSVLTYVLAH